MQVSDLHALHCLVFKFKKQLSGIVDKSDQKDFKAILDRLGDYANKTAFEKLEPKDRSKFLNHEILLILDRNG